jgi:hypothetical protein
LSNHTPASLGMEWGLRKYRQKERRPAEKEEGEEEKQT